MAKPNTKTSKMSNNVQGLKTLWEYLEQQPDEPVQWPFESDDIGGELLGILSKGLYPDPLDCIREYVQNSVDAKAKNVTVKITGNSVIISDDGMGMNLDGLVQARQLGYSTKSRSEDVGFRGIGIYSGFDICNRLVITTKRTGEAISLILAFNFGEMKAQLKAERDAQSLPTSLTKLLTKNTHFRREAEQVDRHYTIVQLEELSRVHIDQLADHERLRTYMLHNLPIDFADDFLYKDRINSQLENHVPGYNAIRVKLVTDFAPPEIIVRPKIPNLREPIMDTIRNADGKKIAYYWACVHSKGGELPDEFAEYRGLVYKVKGFTIGNRSRLRSYFTTAKGTLYDWCTGEVYIVDENVVPNAARNDFEPSPEKVQLETAVGDAMSEINKAAAKFQEQNNADKEFERIAAYLEDVERKITSYNLSQCSEVHRQLERYIDTLNKKQKKTTLDSVFVQETLQHAERLRATIRQMIDHPDMPSNQPTSSKPSSTVKTPPPSIPKVRPQHDISTPVSRASASNPPVEPMPIVVQPSPPKPTKSLAMIFEQSGLDISGSCTQLIQVIDKSLSVVLTREVYERVLDDLQARLDYEVVGEIESEDE
jgi:molecular chaperone HtpG